MQPSRWHIITAGLFVFLVVAGASFGLGRKSTHNPSDSSISEPLVIIALDDENKEEIQALRKSFEVSEARARLISEENNDLRLEIHELDTALQELSLNAQTLAREKSELQASLNEELSMAREENLSLMAKLKELSNEHKRARNIAIKETDLNATKEQGFALDFEAVATPESSAIANDETVLRVPPLDERKAGPEVPRQTLNAQPGALQRGLAAYKVQDYKNAYTAWIGLAEAGVRRAQFYIGGLYVDGHGVTKDRAMAHYWLTRSSKAGYAPSDPLLSEIVSLMTEEELAAAQKLLSSGQ